MSVPLPTNKTKKSNDTLALNATKTDDLDKKASDSSEDMLGRKKGNFTTNQAFSEFNETVHITYLDPQ